MARLKLFIPLLLFVGLAAVFLGVLTDEDYDPQALPSALVGQMLPAFELASLDGSQTLTPADMPKQTYLLNIWASWCPSCRVEHPFLNELAEKGIPIIGLNYKDRRDAGQNWLNELGNPYQLVIFDEQGRLGLDLGVYGAPETYVIAANGEVLFKHVGVVDQKLWQEKMLGFFQSAQVGGAQP